jgi:hypothetical protein
LRDAVVEHGLRISETFLVGEVADDVATRGVLAAVDGTLWEFEYSSAGKASLRTRDADDLLNARFQALGVGQQMAIERRRISTSDFSEVVFSYFAELPDHIASKVVEVLPQTEATRLRADAQARYAKSGAALTSETLVDAGRITRDQSWKLIRYFSFAGAVVVFTNKRDGTRIFAFASVRDALDVLGECPPFDFYLMDASCSFLFAHDEYDNLFGCGAAKTFLLSL